MERLEAGRGDIMGRVSAGRIVAPLGSGNRISGSLVNVDLTIRKHNPHEASILCREIREPTVIGPKFNRVASPSAASTINRD